MRRLILAATLSLLAGSALAGGTSVTAGSVTAGTASANSASAAAASSSALNEGGAGGQAGASVTTQRQAPAVSAPSLAASSEACMGSASGGVSVAGFGISAGSTWANDECQRRLNSQQLRLLGHNDAALAILCTNSGVAEALAAVGKACPATRARAEVPQQSAPIAASNFCRTWPADLYCRAAQ